MGKRAAAVAQTRRRIVEATLALHGEHGIAATSWDDIAARAGVGVGTVYRHFPTLDELVPACGAITREQLALPDPATMEGLFEPASAPVERVRRLVREAFALYERGARELRTIRREAAVHPDVARAHGEVEASLAALVAAALAPLGASDEDRAVTRALIDLGTWDALRAQGLAPSAAETAIAGLISARLAIGPAAE